MLFRQTQVGILWAVTVLFASCGSDSSDTRSRTLNNNPTAQRLGYGDAPSFEPIASEYLRSFVNDAEKYGVKIDSYRLKSVDFQFVDGPIDLGTQQALAGDGSILTVLGYCEYISNTVKISLPEYWPVQYPSELRFRRAVYHELGHCLLSLPHDDKVVDGYDGRYRIMGTYESLLNSDLNDDIWDDLLKILFDYALRVAYGIEPDILESRNYGLHSHDDEIIIP